MRNSTNKGKLTGATIDKIESEGLAHALNVALEVMEGHGAIKHGPRTWIYESHLHHSQKCRSHINRAGSLDDDSGLPHEAHAVIRALMALAQREDM